MRTEEYFFTCPHCWAHVSVVVDCSQKTQRYVEDCEVCCRPLQIRVRCRRGRVVTFEAEPL